MAGNWKSGHVYAECETLESGSRDEQCLVG